jgi:PAS domain S-box-containing protein
MFDKSSPTAISLLSLLPVCLIALVLILPAVREGVPLRLFFMPLAGAGCLYLIMLFALLTLFISLKNQLSSLRQAIEASESKLETAKSNLAQDIEKRNLEINVINASLNREIAERMQAESEAKKLQKQMELILNSAGEGIFGLDTDGNVTFANTAALLMIGWEAEELIGKPHHELVHHSYQDGTPFDSSDCPISQAFRDGIVHSSSDDVFWTKEGTFFPVEYVSTPIMDNGKIRGAVVVFRDRSTFT